MRVINKENDLIYMESFWSSRKRLFYKDEECFKNEKGNFVYKEGTDEEVEFILKGSYLMGLSISFNDLTIELQKGVRVYEWIITLSFLGFVFYNAILGAIVGATFGIANLVCIRGIKSIAGKIVFSILCALACFGVIFILAKFIKIEFKNFN